MKVGCYMLVWCGVLGLVYSHGSFAKIQLANLLQERNAEPESKTLSCTAEYEKMTGHTLCLTDSPDVTKSGVTDDDKLLITQKHNSLRASVQPPASDLMMLKWDDRLASVAQKWAKQCTLEHDKVNSIPELGMSIGQNIAAGQNTWEAAIQAWYDEVNKYKYGLDPDSYLGVDGWKQIGHFTQIVQSKTYLIGCGYAECSSSQYVRFYVCNYANGQTLASMTNPYTAGTRCGQCPNNCNNGLCDCGGRVCLNGGTLDLNTCKCECPKLYIGDSCENLNCPEKDAWPCGSFFTEGDCKIYANVPTDCPHMCGVCGDTSA